MSAVPPIAGMLIMDRPNYALCQEPNKTTTDHQRLCVFQGTGSDRWLLLQITMAAIGGVRQSSIVHSGN